MRHFAQVLQRSLMNSSRQIGVNAQRAGARVGANARNIHTSPFLRLFARHPERIPNLRSLRMNRRPYSNTPKSGATSSSTSSTEASIGLSARLRKLSREYGWSAFGVYMALSALDFPFCFLAVRSLGTERIGEWEHAIVEWVKRAIPFQWPEKWGGPKKKEPQMDVSEEYGLAWDHGVKEAEAANMGETASKRGFLHFDSTECANTNSKVSGLSLHWHTRSTNRLFSFGCL